MDMKLWMSVARLMGKPFTSKESDYVGNEKINVKAHAQILNEGGK